MTPPSFIQSIAQEPVFAQSSAQVEFPTRGWHELKPNVAYRLGAGLFSFSDAVVARLRRLWSADRDSDRGAAEKLFKAFQAFGARQEVRSLLAPLSGELEAMHGSLRQFLASADSSLVLLGARAAEDVLHFDYLAQLAQSSAVR